MDKSDKSKSDNNMGAIPRDSPEYEELFRRYVLEGPVLPDAKYYLDGKLVGQEEFERYSRIKIETGYEKLNEFSLIPCIKTPADILLLWQVSDGKAFKDFFEGGLGNGGIEKLKVLLHNAEQRVKNCAPAMHSTSSKSNPSTRDLARSLPGYNDLAIYDEEDKKRLDSEIRRNLEYYPGQIFGESSKKDDTKHKDDILEKILKGEDPNINRKANEVIEYRYTPSTELEGILKSVENSRLPLIYSYDSHEFSVKLGLIFGEMLEYNKFRHLPSPYTNNIIDVINRLIEDQNGTSFIADNDAAREKYKSKGLPFSNSKMFFEVCVQGFMIYADHRAGEITELTAQLMANSSTYNVIMFNNMHLIQAIPFIARKLIDAGNQLAYNSFLKRLIRNEKRLQEINGDECVDFLKMFVTQGNYELEKDLKELGWNLTLTHKLSD